MPSKVTHSKYYWNLLFLFIYQYICHLPNLNQDIILVILSPQKKDYTAKDIWMNRDSS